MPEKKHDRYQRWSKEENMEYVSFLEHHKGQFIIEKGRKRKNLFMHMSDELKHQRDNEQCRTHHEKMMKKYKTVQGII